MLRNYIKIAIRNIRKTKLFSFINIAGLALGMGCFLLVAFFVRSESGFDRFHKDLERIHLVVRDNRTADYAESRTNTGAPMAPLLLQTIPQVQDAVRFTCLRSEIVRSGDKQFVEGKFFYADEAVLKVFTFPLAAGDPSTALREPFSVLPTEKTVRRYFGSEDPLHKVLKVNFGGRSYDFQVTGVLKDIPSQSHLDFDFLASYASLPPLVGDWFMTSHWDSPTWNYIRLAPGASPADVERLLNDVVRKHVDKGPFTEIGFRLMALRDVYFKSPGPMPGPRGSASFLVVLSAVALFILLIAAVNFMNLSTSRAGTRAKEIGLRKVVGARRGQLIGQFIGEAVFLSFLAYLLGLALVRLTLPAFNAFLGKELAVKGLRDVPFLLLLAAAAAAVGVLAGSYPALVLSAFKPVLVIRGKVEKGRRTAIRKALVIGQFGISIALIVSVAFIVKQIRFLKGMELGFQKDNIITIPIRDSALRSRYDLLKARWLQQPGVLAVAATSMKPGVGSPNGIGLKARNADDLEMGIIYVDHDYASTLGLRIAAGRDFSKDKATDAANGLMVNRTFLEKLGWNASDAVGQPVELFFKEGGRKVPVAQTIVIGVVEDFHIRSTMTPPQPLLLKVEPRRFGHLLIRVDGRKIPETLDGLKKAWAEFELNQPFEFTFLSDDMNSAFRAVENLGAVTRYAAGLAVLIACLGLFGLASFTIEKRRKEIGVRKVLGASTAGLAGLMIREFLVPVAWANTIAWPAAFYLMSGFLREFAFRTGLSLWVFALAGTLALAVAIVTVVALAVRASLADPVESLRYE